MGAWGTAALTNDDAQDLLDALRPLTGRERVARVHDALVAYATYDRRRRAGETRPGEPEVDDGSRESLTAIAAAWLVAEALGRVPRPETPGLLAAEPASILADLAIVSRRAMEQVLADDGLRATWHHNADAWSAEVRRLHAALAPEAPSVPAGGPGVAGSGLGADAAEDDEDLDDPAALHRHNVLYRWRMLILLVVLLLVAFAMR